MSLLADRSWRHPMLIFSSVYLSFNHEYSGSQCCGFEAIPMTGNQDRVELGAGERALRSGGWGLGNTCSAGGRNVAAAKCQ